MNNIVEIIIKEEEYSVSVTIPKNKIDTLNEICKPMLNILGHLKETNIKLPNASETTLDNRPTTVQKENDYKIRQRIPNNIVDINELDIKQAVIDKALVRCPHCGQAHCLAINSNNNVYVMERDFCNDEFNIIAEFDSLTSSGLIGMCCKPDTDKLAYFNDLQSVSIINYNDFVANNDTEVFCPVCCESSTFINWKDAYENPLKFFETEHLCDICGGEKLEKIIKDKKVYLCESCGHQSEFKEE